LEVDRAVIGGVSMGGYVAFGMVRRAPHRVSGLLLSNTRATADAPEARGGRDRMIAVAREQGASAIAEQMLPKLLGESTRAQQPDLVDAVRRLILMNSPDAIATALGALRDRPDSTPLLHSIECPTLIIAGDEDAIINVSEAEAMHASIPGSSLVVLPRTGHLANLEQPNAWTAALDQWLGGIWAFR
jgi:pimeloyl-ACP methyl ester carboxylesterase